MTRHLPVKERFDSGWSVDRHGCWIWTKCKSTTGYGSLRGLGEKRAHRISYRLHKGQIPAGAHVLHTCDVRACVNPEHLFLGSHPDNMRDMDNKGRRVTRRGEGHGCARLTEESVLAMRQDHIDGMPQNAMARKYGVTQATVSRVVLRKNWRHI